MGARLTIHSGTGICLTHQCIHVGDVLVVKEEKRTEEVESVDGETAPIENGRAEGEGSTLAKKFSKLSGFFGKSKRATQPVPQSMSSSNFLKTLFLCLVLFSFTLSLFFKRSPLN